MNIILAFSMAAGLVGIDQLIKWLVVSNMEVNTSMPLLGNVLQLTYVRNDGGAFNFLGGKVGLLVIVTSVIIVAGIIAIASNKIKSKFLLFSISLIVAGGIGNLIDRIFRHYVVDYIDVHIINFAVFNFADCCVVVGTILLLSYILFYDVLYKRKHGDDGVKPGGADD